MDFLIRKRFLIPAALILLMTAPVSSHDMAMGGSRWCFGKNSLIASIDLRSALLNKIKELKEKNCDVDLLSDQQLQQIASDVIQPYINRKLSVAVDNKLYHPKVIKIVRNEDGLFRIWLSVNNIRFKNPTSAVKIDFRLLFEETGNTYIDIASIYMSDVPADTLQKALDYLLPAAQKTFSYSAPTWELNVNGSSNEAAASPKSKNFADGGSTIMQKSTAGTGPTDKQTKIIKSRKSPALASEGAGSKLTLGSIGRSRPELKENASLSYNLPARSTWSTVREFLLLGIKHILTGYDHIAFLLALIVIGLSLKEVLKIITAFTLAHSITLLLAALEIIRLNSRFVESVIAFSICYVALENLFRRKTNYRWIIACGFGLIHGFGFASALQELISVKSNLVASVLSFNLGVEIGQLLIFFVMLPILHLLKNKLELRIITAATSVVVFILGFTWLIERVFNLRLFTF